jgi:hypothetical protein
VKRRSVWLLGVGALHCAAAAAPTRPQTGSCPDVQARTVPASSASANADLLRVNALNLPHAPGPCNADAECFADDPCHSGLCIEHECSGQVSLNGDQCKTLLSDGSIGHCYRGRCVSGYVPRED